MLPEIRDIFHQVGFKHVDIYWEGDDGKGGGNGDFSHLKKRVENCDSWIAYFVAVNT